MSGSATSSDFSERLDKVISSDSATSLPELLAASFPPLAHYCPVLPTVSRQQGMFLLTPTSEALYGGAVGGGKTAALLMSALMYVDVPGYSALILRRTFPELEQPDGPIPQSLRWFATVPEAYRPSYNQGEHTWRFVTGAVIRFGHLESPAAMMKYQGGAYHFVGFDELTHFEQEQYEFIGLSRQRKPPDGPLSEVPMRIRASANPGGPGHSWVKKRFIDAREPGVTFVPAKVYDNPGIDSDDYVQRLMQLSPIVRQQLLDGDWGAFEGRAFEVFDPTIHVLDEFEPPRWWDRFESFDYGLNNPTAWLVWAADQDENLVIFDSYYKPGLPSETAPIIRARRSYWHSSVAYGDPASLATRTGSQRWQKFGDPATIQTEFEDAGLPVIPANNNPKSGYLRLRALLEPDPKHRFPDWHSLRGELGSPRLFIVGKHAPELVDQLSDAPLQPLDRRHGGEIIDPQWEGPKGHAVAAARYGAMSRPKPSNEPDPEADVPPNMRAGWANPEANAAEMRAEALERYEKRAVNETRGRYVNV